MKYRVSNEFNVLKLNSFFMIEQIEHIIYFLSYYIYLIESNISYLNFSLIVIVLYCRRDRQNIEIFFRNIYYISLKIFLFF